MKGRTTKKKGGRSGITVRRFLACGGLYPRLLDDRATASDRASRPMNRCHAARAVAAAPRHQCSELRRWPHQRRETRDIGEVIGAEGDQSCPVRQSLSLARLAVAGEGTHARLPERC